VNPFIRTVFIDLHQETDYVFPDGSLWMIHPALDGIDFLGLQPRTTVGPDMVRRAGAALRKTKNNSAPGPDGLAGSC